MMSNTNQTMSEPRCTPRVSSVSYKTVAVILILSSMVNVLSVKEHIYICVCAHKQLHLQLIINCLAIILVDYPYPLLALQFVHFNKYVLFHEEPVERRCRRTETCLTYRCSKSVYQNCLKLRHVSGQRGVLRWSYVDMENRNTELTDETPAPGRCMETSNNIINLSNASLNI